MSASSDSEGRRDERSLADRVPNRFLEMRYKRNRPMTFDELSRLDFDRKRVGLYSDNKSKALGLIALLGDNPNELLLTAEDCVFLLEVGISP